MSALWLLMQSFDDLLVGAGKGVVGKLFGPDPFDGIGSMRARAARKMTAGEDVQGDAEMGVGVFDLHEGGENLDGDAELFAGLADDGLFEGFAGFVLAAGEFPQTAQQTFGGPQVNEQFIMVSVPYQADDDVVMGR